MLRNGPEHLTDLHRSVPQMDGREAVKHGARNSLPLVGRVETLNLYQCSPIYSLP
jgi:hypothetical protein